MKTVVKAGWVVACITVVNLIGVPASWAAKIARVDMNKVVQEYQKARDMQMEMEKEFMDKKAVLKIMSDQLDKQQAELTTKKGVVSQQEYDGLKSKFDAGRNAFQEKYK
jgi:Outer membrane protein (OmpH-like).